MSILHSIAFLCILLYFSTLAHAQSFLDRVWKDKTGKHSIQATLYDISENEAALRTADGRNVRVPRSSLGEEELKFLASLDRAKASELQFNLLLPHFGRMYQSPKAVSEIIAELHKQHREGFAAGLYAGWIYATHHGKRGLADAVKFTDEATQRVVELNKELPDAHQQTLSSLYNNRAILALREHNAGRAATLLARAASLSDDVPFVVYHNATLLLEVTSQPHSLLNLERSERNRLVQLLAKTPPEGPRTKVPPRFMYSTLHDDFTLTSSAPPQPPTEKPVERTTELPPIEAGFQLHSYGSGFLVAPNLVVTNRHVVEGYELGLRYRVRNERSFSSGALASVKKVSNIDEIDLAVLELQAPALLNRYHYVSHFHVWENSSLCWDTLTHNDLSQLSHSVRRT